MSNTSVKNRVRANRARLRLLQQLILATNGVYCAIRAGVFRATFDRQAALLWAFFALLYAGPYLFLAWAARPTYGGSGELVDGGEDLSQRGVLEYAHDVLYLTALAHVGCVFTPYAALLLAAMPVFFAASLCTKCCGGGGSEEVAEAEAAADALGTGLSRKDRRKADRAGKMN